VSSIITGASGYIGRHLVSLLAENGLRTVGSVRTNAQSKTMETDCIIIGNITTITDWDKVLAGVDTIFHLAARAHVL